MISNKLDLDDLNNSVFVLADTFDGVMCKFVSHSMLLEFIYLPSGGWYRESSFTPINNKLFSYDFT